MNLVW